MNTPPGGGLRMAAVRTLRPIMKGEEPFVRYGADYWRFSASWSKSKAQQKQQPGRRGQAKNRRSLRNRPDVNGVPAHQLIAELAAMAEPTTQRSQQAAERWQRKQRTLIPSELRLERGGTTHQ